MMSRKTKIKSESIKKEGQNKGCLANDLQVSAGLPKTKIKEG